MKPRSILVLALLAGCRSPGATAPASTTVDTHPAQVAPTTDTSMFKVIGDSVQLPAFQVAIRLSANAEERLRTDKETIKVSAEFYGLPEDTTKVVDLDDSDNKLGSTDRELSTERLARFEGCKISKDIYDSWKLTDMLIEINVFSGRRSTGDNLLDCGNIQEKLSLLMVQTDTIQGKLITETNQ
jgi:hypothetical protein